MIVSKKIERKSARVRVPLHSPPTTNYRRSLGFWTRSGPSAETGYGTWKMRSRRAKAWQD